MNYDFDAIIIGAGVVGLSIGHALSKNGKKILILEKNNKFGLLNSSRNTEVIHAGIYYDPNSLKKRLCIEGKNLLYEFCQKYKIKNKKIGKLFLASDNNDLNKLDLIFENAKNNGISLLEINQTKLKEMEPNIIGKYALFSDTSGIFDSYDFLEKLEYLIQDDGGIIAYNTPFYQAKGINNNSFKIVIGDMKQTTNINCKYIINCAGMYALDISNKVFSKNKYIKNNYVKGSYLKMQNKNLINHIIYPAIIPGKIEERVDCSPTIFGDLRFGPSIEKNFIKEDFDVPQNLKERFLPQIQKYIKNFDGSKLQYDLSGIRPRIIINKNSNPDFYINWQDNYNWLNLYGIESPGLTSSLAIGDYVLDLVINTIVWLIFSLRRRDRPSPKVSFCLFLP